MMLVILYLLLRSSAFVTASTVRVPAPITSNDQRPVTVSINLTTGVKESLTIVSRGRTLP